MCRCTCNIDAAKVDAPASGPLLSCEHLEKCALARTVGPNEASQFAVLETEVHTRDRLNAAEVFLQTVGLEDGLHHSNPNSQQELDWNYERATLEKVFRLWGRPVHLETDEITVDERSQQSGAVRVVDSYDGETHTSQTLTLSS